MSTATTLSDYGPNTIDDFDALPEDTTKRYELIDGRIVVSPRPTLEHQDVAFELCTALKAVLPADHHAFMEAEISFADRQQCLAPDVLVTRRRHTKAQRRAAADDVLLAIEVLSPGSKRTDRQSKPRIYAAAKIPAYWQVETDPFAVIEHQLVGRWHEVSQTVTGDEIVTARPFDLKIDLSAARAATLPDGA